MMVQTRNVLCLLSVASSQCLVATPLKTRAPSHAMRAAVRCQEEEPSEQPVAVPDAALREQQLGLVERAGDPFRGVRV